MKIRKKTTVNEMESMKEIMKGVNTEDINRTVRVIVRRLYFILYHSWKSLPGFNHGMTTSDLIFKVTILDPVWRMEYWSQWDSEKPIRRLMQ